MNELFKSLYFGKPFKTRNGKKVRFCGTQQSMLVFELDGIAIDYFIDGSFYSSGEGDLDIVAEWTDDEVLSEDKLNERAEALAEEYFLTTYNNGIQDPNLDIINEKEYAVADFKAGFNKALDLFKL